MKNRSLIIRATISLIFVFILARKVFKEDFFETLKHIDLFYFAASFVLSLFMISVSCLKWQILIRQQGYPLSFSYLLRVYFIGYFFSNLLPSNVGGDVVRSYYVGEKIANQARSAVAVFMERFTGMLLLLSLVIIAPFFQPEFLKDPFFIIPALIAIGLLVCVIWVWQMSEPSLLPTRIFNSIVSFLRTRLGRLKGLLKALEALERLFFKIMTHVDSFHIKLTAAGKDIGAQKKWLIPVGGLTIVFYLATLLNVYFAYRAFHVSPDFRLLAGTVPAVMMLIMMPAGLLGNLGFTENVFIFYFTRVGMGEGATTAMALLLRFKMIVIALIGWYYFWVDKESFSAKKLLKGYRKNE